MLSHRRAALSLSCALIFAGSVLAEEAGFTPLFPEDGIPKGWQVRAWDDVKNPGPEGAEWKVIDGVLHGSEPRGTWLVSEKEYSDFVLKFDFKLGERGNSGCGIRFPAQGDPAFDGLELQMVDPRYYPADMEVPSNELTGSLYRAVAPTEQLLKPTEWNSYEAILQGSRVEILLNGKKVIDTNLDDHESIIKRHNGQDAVPLKDRPRKGHIGFQELSRGGAHVEIRNARIKELIKSAAEPVKQQPGSEILLHSRVANVHGDLLRYEPQPNKDTLGYWMKQEDWASWDFEVATPGKYQVLILQGCGPGSGGSKVKFSVGDQNLTMAVQETRGFQDFIERTIGTVEFDEPGKYQLTVKPEMKPGLAVMDLRQVRLIPVSNN